MTTHQPETRRLPLSIRRRSGPSGPTEALLLRLGPGRSTREALALLSIGEGEGASSSIRIFEVAGGLLVVLGGEVRRGPAGSVRLRRLAPNFFVPVDAEPRPTLLDDEARGMTRDLGLVLLPGGEALGFDPARPLPISALLEVPRRTGIAWERPPEPPRRAPRLVGVSFDSPDDRPDAFLDAEADDLAAGELGSTEPNDPDRPGAPQRALGRAALGAGRGMMRLGGALGMKGLAGLGSRWAASALRMAPRLGEALLGRQEMALRELLKDFREGNVDRALSRALPMGKGNDRGASVAGSADLPNRDPSYSLAEILGAASAGGGRASYWFGGADVLQELIREYHKAAQEAARRGDHRRAAFIYARLLEDYSLAANALLQGGLARDAALIYLEKLNDRASAARAFEAAGEFDRALGLYRSLGDFERVGELLLRLGEPERALRAFIEAADRIVEREHDHLKAGELLRTKAGRPDLAARYFADGWRARPGPNAVGCAIELARLLAESGDVGPLLTLADEADAMLASRGLERDASRFYNAIVQLADGPAVAPIRDDLRDRSLVGLARKLRERRDSGGAISGAVQQVFGSARGWSAALFRDAEYAMRAPGRPEPVPAIELAPEPPPTTTFRVLNGPVSASAFARKGGLAFVGNIRGEVVRLDLATGQSTPVGRYAMPVASLATTESGDLLVVLWHDPDSGRTVIASYSKGPDGAFSMVEGRAETARSSESLPFLVSAIDDPIGSVGFFDGRRYIILRGPSLTPWAEIERGSVVEEFGPSGVALLVPYWGEGWAGATSPPAVLEMSPAGSWPLFMEGNDPHDALPIPWGLAPTGGPASPSLSVSFVGPLLHLAGVGEGGVLYHTRIVCSGAISSGSDVATASVPPAPEDEGHYLAASVVRPGLVAGVRASAVDQITVTYDLDSIRLGTAVPGRHIRTKVRSSTPITLGPALAAMPSHRTGDLVLLFPDGRVERVTIPGS